ncbi:unnamed protein product [Polarella glacialis]|uniref:RNA helicase n=1 Tax=Polarella glacialis TaxID=89957 RepID=A0A813I5J5_POLGL|nr:unnamed protein product [Polarella glacialis]
MEPRPHQLECLQQILAQNTIVNMPTGTGKTLVSVLAIDHFRTAGKVLFIVPTRPLVEQQANYIRKHGKHIGGAPPSVEELSGAQTDHLSALDWVRIVRDSEVLVGTPEVFRRALVDTRFLSFDGIFSLVVFDECHNATGNSPMAAIMRDSIHRCALPPRILGLTASFVHGSLKGIDLKRKALEGLLQSCIFCPEIQERQVNFSHVPYKQTVWPEMKELVQARLSALVSRVSECGIPMKETGKLLTRGGHVFEELGLAAFLYFVRESVAPQVEVHIQTLLEVLPSAKRAQLKDLQANLPRLRQVLRDSAEQLANEGALTAFPHVTDKAKVLFDLLRKLSDNNNNNSGRGRRGSAMPRVIMFCEQTVLVHPLAHLVQASLQDLGLTAMACSGVGTMSDSQRSAALQAFRSGLVSVLVCTAALEEGLDVQDCEVVIRFSQFQTTKSHIQGSGRARAWNAQVFYFDNDPSAGPHTWSKLRGLTEQEMEQHRQQLEVAGVHPYRTEAGAEISVFNCVQIVYEFASKALGQSFRPAETMLHYTTETVCVYPPQVRKSLTSVSCPSPAGLFQVLAHEVDAWWGSTDVTAVVDASRTRNWEPADLELRRFLYVVAVTLSRRSLLDAHNQPSAEALRETRKICEAWVMSPGIRLSAKFTPQSSGSSQMASDNQNNSSKNNNNSNSNNNSTQQPSLSLMPQASAASTAETNFKGSLNELTTGAFLASVTLHTGEQFFGSALCTTKKAAEQLAAKVALDSLQGSKQRPATAVKGNSASSSTDTLEMQLLRILRATAGSVPLAQIRTQLSVEKAELNRVLYSLQAQGLVRKTSESPPVWAAVA